MSLKRKRSENRKKADAVLLPKIEAIKSEHPFWGYWRIWAYLNYRQGEKVGKNRVYRVMKKNKLLVTKALNLKAKRNANTRKPVATRLNEYWGMDMTKIKFPNGWWYLHVVKDWYSKEIVGYSFSYLSRTEDWLAALNNALNKRFPEGARQTESLLSLITDNGCQPTSERFMKACSTLGVKQIKKI